MPYDGQPASKGGHADLIRNPQVKAFLSKCEVKAGPSDAEGEKIADTYHDAPKTEVLPELVVASDSSPFSEPVKKDFPSTQVGYVNVSLMGFDMCDYNGLQPQGSKFVDPHAVASFHRKAQKASFVLPGSNVRYGGKEKVQDGFRQAVFEQLSDDQTRIDSAGPNIVETMLHIEGGSIVVKKCPACGEEHIFPFNRKEMVMACPSCKADVYVTDSLRIHEQMSDFGDNTAAVTRFMNAAEHLQICALVYTMDMLDLDRLSNTAIIVDGPLALFGQPAKFHASIQAFYNAVFDRCRAAGKKPPLIMGLQKEGQVMEHARSLSRFLRPGTFQVISDDYRARYINGIEPDNTNFGNETYYGQDFIYKTDAGQIFDVCLAYPIAQKAAGFGKQKADLALYQDWLARAFKLIRHLEFDLYESAVVPIALAHRHASISLKPGGAMLNVLTKNHLGI